MNDVMIPGEGIHRSLLDPTWSLLSQIDREFPVLVGVVEDREAFADALRSGH
ncbi:hypothetical protein ACFC1L_39845 [Streptomyces sp. NPDC056210]|uniref:hypothetical protein n=1 Tax=Streptomyces sp. NPDC056210 TaxID=3345746 RepID=UPI0035DDC2AD